MNIMKKKVSTDLTINGIRPSVSVSGNYNTTGEG